MKYLRIASFFAALTLLSGCAVFRPVHLNIGESEANVIAKLGQPTARIPDGEQHLLEYSHNPWGQAIYMARIGSNGRLVSYQQVLTIQKFATIKPGISTQTDVLHTIGHPSEIMRLARRGLTVWSYPYKEQDVWNSVMSVYLNDAGIVRMMENGPDPRFDKDGRFGF